LTDTEVYLMRFCQKMWEQRMLKRMRNEILS